jgi:zinc protease
MHKTVADFVFQGPSEAQLTAAKKNITGGFPMRFDTNKELLKYISMIAFHDLPVNYLTLYPEKVLAVTTAQIKEAFERRIVLESLTTVTVGDKRLTDVE